MRLRLALTLAVCVATGSITAREARALWRTTSTLTEEWP